MAPRPDKPLIKLISDHYGADVGRRWQSLPYVYFPLTPLIRYMHDRVSAPIESYFRDFDLVPLPPAGPDLGIDVILDLGEFMEALFGPVAQKLGIGLGSTIVSDVQRAFGLGAGPLHGWVRVTEGGLYAQRAATYSPWVNKGLMYAAADVERMKLQPLQDGMGYHIPDFYIMEMWVPTIDQLLPVPRSLFLPRHEAWNHDRAIYTFVSAAERDSPYSARGVRVISYLVGACLAYLCLTDDYLAEVTEPRTPAQARADRKNADGPKPYTREDMTRWILIDPVRARELGQPQSSPAPDTERRSRNPLSVGGPRRGYDKILRAARWRNKRGQTIHVRPTWVGPKEWADTEGRRYRVVDPTRYLLRQEKGA